MQTLKTKITEKKLNEVANKFGLDPFKQHVPTYGYRWFFNGRQSQVKPLIAKLRDLGYNAGGDSYHGIEINKELYTFSYI